MSEYWMITERGHRVDVLSPDPAEIDIADIALGLAQPRYSGQAPWSIAQHSILVGALATQYATKLRDNELLLPGLTVRKPPVENGAHARLAGHLHDGHEAIIGDTPGPMQGALYAQLGVNAAAELKHVWRLIESQLDDAIWVALCRDVVRVQLQPPATMDPDLAKIVRLADLDALLIERAAFWPDACPPVGSRAFPKEPWHYAVEARAEAVHYAFESRAVANTFRGAREKFDRLRDTAIETHEHANLWLSVLFECLAAYDRTPNLEP